MSCIYKNTASMCMFMDPFKSIKPIKAEQISMKFHSFISIIYIYIVNIGYLVCGI